MIKTRVFAVVLTALAILCGSAVAYDPLFLVTDVGGDCSIIRPGTSVAIPAQAQRAYPYGTRIVTGLDGAVRLIFGEGSECRIAANSIVTLSQDDANVDWKQVQVEIGDVTVELIPEFSENGSNRITIETMGAIAEPTDGGEFAVNVALETDLSVAKFHTLKGEMKLYDNHLFMIPALKNDNRAEIASSLDRSFIRYSNTRGKQIVELSNVTTEDGGPKIVEMQTSSVLKMWREKSTLANTWVVSILIIEPDGALQDAIHYNAIDSGGWNN